MGQTKQLFEIMRAEEIANLYDHSFSKKEAVESGKRLVDYLFQMGEVNPLLVFSNIARLKEVVNSIDTQLRSKLDIFETETLNGVTFTPVNGGESLNYKDCPVYLDLFNQLKEREDLLKIAYKSNNELYDENGIQVPKVSSSPRKSSITVKF